MILPELEIVNDLMERSDLVDLPQTQIEDAFDQVFDGLDQDLPTEEAETSFQDPWLDDMDVLLTDESSGIPEDVDTDLVSLFESLIPESEEDLSLAPQAETALSIATPDDPSTDDLGFETSIQFASTISLEPVQTESLGDVTGDENGEREPDFWDTLATEPESTLSEDLQPGLTAFSEEDFAPAPLTLDADDEAAFADLFINAAEQAATEEIPDMAWISQDSGLNDRAEQPEWSEAVIEAKADQDLADLFGDLSEEPLDVSETVVTSSAITDVLDPFDVDGEEPAVEMAEGSADLSEAVESSLLSFSAATTQILDAPDLTEAENVTDFLEEQVGADESFEDFLGDPFADAEAEAGDLVAILRARMTAAVRLPLLLLCLTLKRIPLG
ncbi:MAG: hypothetical protein HC818_02970 [Synechococcaceae cyanobacterium RM1_1_27]|nr:hypothetical protein [Synechococcaceae cyanobacterium RM1_1_27]